MRTLLQERELELMTLLTDIVTFEPENGLVKADELLRLRRTAADVLDTMLTEIGTEISKHPGDEKDVG